MFEPRHLTHIIADKSDVRAKVDSLLTGIIGQLSDVVNDPIQCKRYLLELVRAASSLIEAVASVPEPEPEIAPELEPEPVFEPEPDLVIVPARSGKKSK